MRMIHLLAGAISMAMASAAIAQDTSGSATGADPAATGTDMLQMTQAERDATADWTGPIADALFTDPSKTSLRSEEEIRTNWAQLSAEQQNQVKEDCNTVQTAAAGTGTTTGTTTPSDDTTASTTPDTTTGGTAGTASGETTASTTTGTTAGTADPSASTGAGGVMSVAQLCNIVQNM
ncbi:Large exoproteins involved in heme utilization or adhesion (plasmid) [Sinorhizobium sojae CCBAU 05684]|uniref:Large exoproteins involved in heme utilization or adhesion n=1 Tax=Sinorhizobium sojae CCBAU 05684 TaxID=716928 RepID=A0A249PJJ2_9HYPH|nr:hypothetical protein [Sinorhizobium sojae]ASY65489.1 Large exoproteins involved in heme utilization or adhesion [Sinorhizobium sojae CCBAU 05684]